MQIYFAPLEGITGYIYRNAFSRYFGKTNKFFTPFLTPGGKKGLSAKERADILPEHNCGMTLVPQLLTRNAEDFLRAATELEAYGYREVNLNLGCPSGTVVGKGRGAGMLADPDALQGFLDEVFSHVKVEVSVKTRIGLEDPAEWEELLRIFNRYPLKELIVHPRLRSDYYNGNPDLDAFAYALRESKNPLCYNGDITTAQGYRGIRKLFPVVDRVMIGRGLLADPFLLERIQLNLPDQRERFFGFHRELLEGYREYMSGETPVLFKMKELWFYMQQLFPEDSKLYKKIKKAKNLAEYESIVRSI